MHSDPGYGQSEYLSESGSVLFSEQGRRLEYSRVSNVDHGTISFRLAYGASIPVHAEIPESADPLIPTSQSGFELFFSQSCRRLRPDAKHVQCSTISPCLSG